MLRENNNQPRSGRLIKPAAGKTVAILCFSLIAAAFLGATIEIGSSHARAAALSLDAAAQLNQQAAGLIQQGRYADAESLVKQALEAQEAILGPDGHAVMGSLNELSYIYSSEGRQIDSLPILKRLIKLQETKFGPRNIYVAYTKAALANAYLATGDVFNATAEFRGAIVIAEGSSGASLQGLSIQDLIENLKQGLGNAFVAAGRYDEAEAIFREVLQKREAQAPPLSPPNAICSILDALGQLYLSQGLYGKAEMTFLRSLKMQEADTTACPSSLASAFANIGSVYKTQGRYADAEEFFKKAIREDELKNGSQNANYAANLNNLALLYDLKGDYAAAISLYKRAEDIVEKTLGNKSSQFATIVSGLGVAEEHNGDTKQAEILFRHSINIIEHEFGVDHPGLIPPLSSLALLFQIDGRYADAAALYKRALSIEKRLPGIEPNILATLYNNIGLNELNSGNIADAEAALKESIAIRENSFGHSSAQLRSPLNNLALLYYKIKNYESALYVVRRMSSIGVANYMPSLAILNGAEEEKKNDAGVYMADSFKIIQESASSAAAIATNKLGQRYAAGSTEIGQIIRRDQDLAGEKAALDKLLIVALSKPAAERNADADEHIRKRLGDIESEMRNIKGSLADRFPEYVALTKPSSLTVEQVQALLEADEAVIAIYVGERSYGWVVTRTSADWAEVPTNETTVNKEVQTLRESLSVGAKQPFDTELAYKMFQQTLAPFGRAIAGKKRLSVFLNGALTSLPLQVLVTTDPKGKDFRHVDWLVKSYAITNLPSIYSLKTLRNRDRVSEAPRSMIAFADPVFSQKARNKEQSVHPTLRSMPEFYEGTQIDVKSLGEALPQLPGTRTEVEAVAGSVHAETSDLKFGADASTDAVRKAPLDQYRVVYFATHGLVAGDLDKFAKAKAEPALVLTIPEKPTEADDGLLRASDIASLKLNADWAVLSACNTGSSDGVGAEALSGLAQAFLYAGARSLVVSHWDVNDKAAIKLMSDLFSISVSQPELSHGEALQSAELQWLNTAKDEEAHPRYWAPFVVVGEPAKTR